MLRRPSAAALALPLLLLAAACSDKRDPITINGGIVTVDNYTSHEWRNVMVTVNDHFHGGAPRLAAGSRLTAPLTQFQTAYGQRFSIDRQSVFKVEVTATDDAGQPVKLQWGMSRR
jgi:hypothetical protein